MGAWIEIYEGRLRAEDGRHVAPHDGCVDWNDIYNYTSYYVNCRTPRWVRGLKSVKTVRTRTTQVSHPTMGAWIEIQVIEISPVFSMSHPTMGAWIEIRQRRLLFWCDGSHPTMGAWIEISFRWVGCKGCRQSHPTMGAWIEIMDKQSQTLDGRVAPHDGCVDWNPIMLFTSPDAALSHPTMGAWIEIWVR